MRKLTDNEIMTLVWVKCLNDYKDDTCPEELYEKVRKFSPEDCGISKDKFEEALEGLAQIGVLTCENNELELLDDIPKYVLTTRGNIVMKALSPIINLHDDTIVKIVNGIIILADFVKKHGATIMNILVKTLEN